MAKRTLNLDDHAVKQGLMIEIGSLRGLWDVELKARKRTRNLDQNAYYFVAVCKPFAEWCSEEWQEDVSVEQAHEMLKHKILGTGSKSVDGVYLPPTTTKLDITEFSNYIESCARWLAEFTGIAVVPSELFYLGATEKEKPRESLKTTTR